MDAIFNYKVDQADDLYAIIGCDELSTTEQILTEYRIKAVECHPDKNPGNPNTLERFQKLQKAKEILTDVKKRDDYDLWRRSGLSLPYDEWVARRDSIKMSMHWVVKTKKEPAIEAARRDSIPEDEITTSNSSPFSSSSHLLNQKPVVKEPKVYWTSTEGSETLRKFRNYEI